MFSRAALAHRVSSLWVLAASSLTSRGASLFHQLTGIAAGISVSAIQGLVWWDINAFAKEFHTTTSVIDARTSPTPSGAATNANANKATPYPGTSAYQNWTTAQTGKQTAQWEHSSTRNRKNAWLARAAASAALARFSVFLAIRASPWTSSPLNALRTVGTAASLCPSAMTGTTLMRMAAPRIARFNLDIRAGEARPIPRIAALSIVLSKSRWFRLAKFDTRPSWS